MNTQVLIESYNKVVTERNRLLVVSGVIGMVAILLALSNVYLIGKERIVIVPPVVSQEFWVASNTVSDSYLEQMSQFFAGLLLNVTPNTFGANAEHLLQNVVPENHAAVKSQLVQQKFEIERRGMTTSFHPASFKIDRKNLCVEIKGELRILVGNAALESKTRTYRIKFVHQYGRLFIQSFNEVQNA